MLLLDAGVVADTQNQCATSTLGDERVLQENDVRVLSRVVSAEALLLGALDEVAVFVVFKDFALVNKHILLLDEDTVRGDSVAGSQKDDVTHDHVGRVDFLEGAVLSTNGSRHGMLCFFKHSQKLVLFAEVTARLNECEQRDSHENGVALEPRCFIAVRCLEVGKED